MAVIKVKRVTNGGYRYLENTINYLSRDKNGREVIDVGGYGVNPDDPKDAAEQMKAVKEYYGKTGDNPIIHIMVSHDSSVKNDTQACEYSKQFAEYFAPNYQVYYATHCNENGYDTHLTINSVNYNNGMLFRSGANDMKSFCDFVSELTGQKTSLYFEKNGK